MAANRTRATSAPALSSRASVIPPLPRIAVGQRTAAGADLRLTITGGARHTPVTMKIVITLNARPVSGPSAELIDETAGVQLRMAVRSGRSYVFNNVSFPAPGTSAARVFRITNVRVNANVLSGGGVPATPVIAATTRLTATPPVQFSQSAPLTLATVAARSRKTRSRGVRRKATSRRRS